MFRRDCYSIEPRREEPGRRKTREPGCDISVPLGFLSSHDIWSADPDINNNTNINLRFKLLDQNEIHTMTCKSPKRYWKTVDWKTSGQLKTLDKEQADLFKLFSRHLTDLKGHLTQNKTMTAESAYRGFFETYDNLETNRKERMLLLKPKYLEAFNNDNKRILKEKSKALRSVVDKVPFLRDIKNFRAQFSYRCDENFRAYKTVKAAYLILSELSSLEKKLKTENISESEKQTLCNQVKQLLGKLNEIFAEEIRLLKLKHDAKSLRASVIVGTTRDLIKQ